MEPQHIRDLSPKDRGRLAPLVGTSAESLRQYASGKRQMSASMAIAVERAGKRIGFFLPREMHAVGCGECEFAKACRKAQNK